VSKYRNISGRDLFVQLDDGRIPLIEADAVIEFPEGWPYYIQTGETGEEALFELIGAPASEAPNPEKGE